ncbi:PREDICTED: uncharacterized protein LOC104800781 [Tarenaya hassleriana]|uniref:uncharacterized protein LOC104800781 n=1 Tax=Tarenaya hassleriana TaxID=28532 RepID=UPI00053C4E83|nr:PREDICTED: uncharacterized protein LOC104800781 [Tarenaya hassleriana]
MPQLDNSRVSTTKLLNREAAGEDYFGGSSASVPFKWESQPGTPKRLFKHASVSDSDPVPAPPLTPPPSYFYPCSSPKTVNRKPNTLLGSVLRKNRSRRASAPSSPACSSPSSSSSSACSSGSLSCSVPSSPAKTSEFRGVNRAPNRRIWFGYGSDQSKCGGCYASIVNVLLRDAK